MSLLWHCRHVLRLLENKGTLRIRRRSLIFWRETTDVCRALCRQELVAVTWTFPGVRQSTVGVCRCNVYSGIRQHWKATCVNRSCRETTTPLHHYYVKLPPQKTTTESLLLRQGLCYTVRAGRRNTEESRNVSQPSCDAASAQPLSPPLARWLLPDSLLLIIILL